ncbi:MAG: COG4223 family protein [Rhizobiaceae bacterium]
MVKTPKTRHYKPQRAPVTIDLEANAADETPAKAVESTESEVASALERAESPAAAGGFEPWLGPDQSAPGVEKGADTRASDDEPSDASKAEATPPDVGDVQPSVTAYGRGAASEAGSSKPPKSQAVQPPPPRSGLSSLAAGLIGGVSALAIAGLLQFAGLLGAPGGGVAAPDLSGVQTEISGLKSEIAALKSSAGGDGGAAVAGLTSSLDQVKADLAALQSAVQTGAGGDGAAVGALDAKVKELEGAIANLSQSAGGAAQEEVAALTAKLATLEQSLVALTGKVDAQGAQPKIALAISAAALKSALDRGSAFAAELETFAAISPNAPEIQPLRAYADQGVMTRADITKAFPDAANAMVAAAAPVDQNAGFFQRLLSSAELVVKVRPVGEVPGEDPPARVARMEVAVNAGDYDKALAEYAALPEAVQAAGGGLVDKIKVRVEVEKLVDQMIAGAMKAA